MVVLTAYPVFLPDQLAAGLAACATVRAASVQEPGCERYDYFQSPEDPCRVVFVEEWTSMADLETHFQQDAFKTFFMTIADKLAGQPEIRIFEAQLQSQD